MYNFKEAVEVIKTKLGEHSTLISVELSKLLSESNSVVSSLSSVNSESAERRIELKTLKEDHAKEMESFSGFEDLKTTLDDTKSQLENSNNELKSVYDDKKSRLKDLSTKIDFKDEKFKSISSRFKGLDNIDELSNQNVNELLGNFELLNVNNNILAQNPPHPRDRQSTTADPYLSVPKA